MNPIKFFNG